MRTRFCQKVQEGKIGWVLLWLLGVPLPIVVLVVVVRGCALGRGP